MYTPANTASFSVTGYAPSNTAVFSGSPDIIGTINGTFDDLTGVISCALVNNIGTISDSFEDLTGLIQGSIENPASAIIINFVVTGYVPSNTAVFVGNVVSACEGTIDGTFDDLTGIVSCDVVNNIGTISDTFEELTGLVSGNLINVIGTISGSFDEMTGLVQGAFDINVFRGLSLKTLCTLEDATNEIIPYTANLQNTTPLYLKACLPYSVAQWLSHDLNTLTANSVPLSLRTTASYQDCLSLYTVIQSTIDLLEFVLSNVHSTMEDAVLVSMFTTSIQDVLTFLLPTVLSPTDDLFNRRQDFVKVINAGSSHYAPSNIVEFIAQGYTPTNAITFTGPSATIYNDTHLGGIFHTRVHADLERGLSLLKKYCPRVKAAIKPPYGQSVRVDRPRPPPIPPPSHEGTTTIPTKEAYTVQHTISVVTVIGNHPVPLSKLSLSYDVDSYAWAFSGVLADKSALSLVQMSNDEPVQLSITINGYNWKVLVESIEQSKSFGTLSINLEGRSLSALLGTPYQLQTSYTAGSDLTVQQIADSLLPYGWTIDWQCATPWLIPANAYSHTQQSTLQALAAIAQNIGAVLVPSRNAQVLTIQPRYPVLPWDFNATGIDADLVIPESAIITVNTQSRTQSPINAVYVHGGENGGVLAWCRLTGTAGDVLAPTANNNLITDVVGARALGERILAGLATQPNISAFTMPLGGDFVLASVGQLVEVMNERAIINGVAIEVEFGKVRQTVTVGEQTNNAYSKLLHLLPSQPLLVGTIASTYADNAILTLLDGGVITARGTGVVGQNYYVRNGLIESAAPNLTPNEIVI